MGGSYQKHFVDCNFRHLPNISTLLTDQIFADKLRNMPNDCFPLPLTKLTSSCLPVKKFLLFQYR